MLVINTVKVRQEDTYEMTGGILLIKHGQRDCGSL